MFVGPDGIVDSGLAGDDGIVNKLGVPAANLTLVDMLRYKLIASLGPGVTAATLTAAQQTQINQQIAKMLPPEVVAGQRFDLNRPFGNGIDDDTNGVIDEPNESGGELSTWGGAFQLDSARPQQRRHLRYSGCPRPAQLCPLPVCDDDVASGSSVRMVDDEYPNNPTAQYELTARRIAQWAVNVVDFRDPDSIMTPFEYDVNPFNGWSVGRHPGSSTRSPARRTTIRQRIPSGGWCGAASHPSCF